MRTVRAPLAAATLFYQPLIDSVTAKGAPEKVLVLSSQEYLTIGFINNRTEKLVVVN